MQRCVAHGLLALMVEYRHALARLARVLTSDDMVLDLARDPCVGPSPSAWRLAARKLVAIETLGITIVPRWCFGPRLAAASPAVVALFVRGRADLLAARAVAIVGARRASAGPLRWAAACARLAVQRDYLVVSGGARGIDAAAHAAALGEGGRTLVYIGVSIDRLYPEANRRLFEQVVQHGGALVSEHPPLTRTFGSSHALRNRFIAAHGERVFLAEAAPDSGSLGTARFAWTYGTPVSVPAPGSEGERGGIDALLAAGRAEPFDPFAPTSDPFAARRRAPAPLLARRRRSS